MNVNSSLRNVEEAMGAMRSLHQLLVHRFIEMHGPGACETLLSETTRLRDEIISEIRHRSAAQQPTSNNTEFEVEYDPDDVEEVVINGVRKPKLFVPPLPADIVAIVSKRRATLRDTESKASCPICQEDYCYGQWIAAIPKCAHEFCEVCCQQWLSICGSCPTCRRVLSEADFFPSPPSALEPSSPLLTVENRTEAQEEVKEARVRCVKEAPAAEHLIQPLQPTAVECSEHNESTSAVASEACVIIARRASTTCIQATTYVRPSSSPSALNDGSRRKVPLPSSLRDHQYTMPSSDPPSQHSTHHHNGALPFDAAVKAGECSSRSRCVSNLRDAVQRDAVAHLRASNSAALGLLRPSSASCGKPHTNVTIGTAYSVFGIPQGVSLLRGSRPLHSANPTSRPIEHDTLEALRVDAATTADEPKVSMTKAFLRPTSAPQRQLNTQSVGRRPFELAPQASQLVIQQKVQPPRDTPASYVASEALHDKPPRPSSGTSSAVRQGQVPPPKMSVAPNTAGTFSQVPASGLPPRRASSASRSHFAARLNSSNNNMLSSHHGKDLLLSQGLMIGGVKLNPR